MKYYTDGSTSPKNPGSGGCAFVVLGREKNYVESQHLGERITNNYAEAYAVFLAISFANIYNDNHPIICTDSEYVVNGIRRINNKRNLLSTNQEVWDMIYGEIYKFKSRHLPVIFVESHSGVVENELADRLAYLATKKIEYEDFILKEEMNAFCEAIKREKNKKRSGK